MKINARIMTKTISVLQYSRYQNSYYTLITQNRKQNQFLLNLFKISLIDVKTNKEASNKFSIDIF